MESSPCFPLSDNLVLVGHRTREPGGVPSRFGSGNSRPWIIHRTGRIGCVNFSEFFNVIDCDSYSSRDRTPQPITKGDSFVTTVSVKMGKRQKEFDKGKLCVTAQG
jgi:hypothetical protein